MGLCVTSSVPSGRALIAVADSGENLIIVVPGANDLVTVDDLPPCAVVLVQLEVPLETVRSVLSAGRRAGATTMLNPAPARELPEELLALCDIVVPNEHEVAMIGGADHLLSLGARAVVVTVGARGAELHAADGLTRVPAFGVQPVDTTGAGDTFCGALAARIAAGDGMMAALRYASAAAAICTTRAGAVPSIPSAAEVGALLSGAG